MSSRIEGVLFDWGDTLFAPPDAARVIAEVAGERGVVVDQARARAIWDELWTLGKTPVELAKGRDLSADAHRTAWTSLFKTADRHIPGIGRALYDRVMDPAAWVPYPDTAPTLRALRERGVKVAIVSNVPRDLSDVFAAHGLASCVDAFVHSFQVGAEKPDPRIFLAACERIGTAPSVTLMVGDHAIADGGATAAGLRFLLLPPHEGHGIRGLDRVLALVDAEAV
ncbi:MAG TPA: HAD-IA family hydrolase [Candidatus Limnocylindria bacterium]